MQPPLARARAAGALRDALAEARAWTAELPDAVRAERAEAIVLHYSCFATAYRGIPLLARPLAGALRRARLPVVAVMHELTYPFGREGLRGMLWASHPASGAAGDAPGGRRRRGHDRGAPPVAAQPSLAAAAPGRLRARLLEPAAAACERRSVIPRRLARCARRCSGTPSTAPPRSSCARCARLSGPSAARAPADRLARSRLRSRQGLARQRGESWASPSAFRSPAFSTPSRSRTRWRPLDLLLFADPPGPTSRKGTLAGSLASGTAVLALDGPSTWAELRDAERADDRPARGLRSREGGRTHARRRPRPRGARRARQALRRNRDGRAAHGRLRCGSCSMASWPARKLSPPRVSSAQHRAQPPVDVTVPRRLGLPARPRSRVGGADRGEWLASE